MVRRLRESSDDLAPAADRILLRMTRWPQDLIERGVSGNVACKRSSGLHQTGFVATSKYSTGWCRSMIPKYPQSGRFSRPVIEEDYTPPKCFRSADSLLQARAARQNFQKNLEAIPINVSILHPSSVSN